MGCKPILVDAGTAPIPNIDMSYIPIPPPPNDPNRVTRGITDIDHAVYIGGRIEAVEVTINSAVTSIAALTEVIAHEFGHTFGLGDCNYPGCPVGSSVMEANATVQNVNSTIGQPGPTSCDINAVILVAPDYYCTPPPLPPPICHRIQTCQEGYAWFDYPDCACEPDNSPIIVDVSGKGFQLTSAANGVEFDISGTGHLIQIAWTAAGADNAFLALPGEDGIVHNGKQLFGNFTPQPASSTPNGFAALAVYDLRASGGNVDGVIDARDAIFSSLRLWIDANHDGICQPGELRPLLSLGVETISLHYRLAKRQDEFGNRFRYRSRLNPDDTDFSHVGRIAYDVFFVVADPTAARSVVPANAERALQQCPLRVLDATGARSTGRF